MSYETASERDPADLAAFQQYLSVALADLLGSPLRAVEAAVDGVTAGWSVEVHHLRPVTDPHDRFCIHTPWAKVDQT